MGFLARTAGPAHRLQDADRLQRGASHPHLAFLGAVQMHPDWRARSCHREKPAPSPVPGLPAGRRG